MWALFFLLPLSFAQKPDDSGPKEIFLQPLELSEKAKPSRRFLHRHSIDVLLRLTEYSLILDRFEQTNVDALESPYALRGRVKPRESEYGEVLIVTLELLNLKKRQVEKSVERISSLDDLPLSFRLGLYELFLGEAKTPEEEKERREQTRKFQDLYEKNAKNRSDKDKSNRREADTSLSAKKVPGAGDIRNRGATGQMTDPKIKRNKRAEANQSGGEEQELAKKKKSLPNESENPLAKSPEDPSAEADEGTKSELSPKEKAAQDRMRDGLLPYQKLAKTEGLGSFYGNSPQFFLGLGPGLYAAANDGLIDIQTDLQYLHVLVRMDWIFQGTKGSESSLNAQLYLSHATNAGDLEFDLGRQLMVGYRKRKMLGGFFVGGLAEFQDLYFAILKGVGQGLAINNNSTVWVGAELGHEAEVFGRGYQAAVQFYRSFFTNSSAFDDVTAVGFTGNKIVAEFFARMHSDYYVGLRFSQIGLGSNQFNQPLTVNIQRTQVLFFYGF